MLSNAGICPACGSESSRFTADFAPDGQLRGALCRACMEMARLVTYDDAGQVDWSTNPAFCQMVAGYFADHCRLLEVGHTDKVDQVCEACETLSNRWLGLGAYLADRLGQPYDATARWHQPESEPEPTTVKPLFLAPS